MLTLRTSSHSLFQQLVVVLRANQIEFATPSDREVSLDGPFWGDAYDEVIVPQFFEKCFSNWCVVTFEDQQDEEEFRNQLMAKNVEFMEERAGYDDRGFVLSSRDAPVY